MARRKRKKKTAKPKQKKGTSYVGPLIGLGIAFLVMISILLYTAEDRSWQEYIAAGDRAYNRGNYAWAEKMYRQALHHAEQKGLDDPLVSKTRRYLHRLERARSSAP